MTSAILFQPTQLYGCTASAPAVRRPPRLVRPPIPSPTPKKCVGVCHAREGKPHGDNRELRKKNPTGRAGLAWVPPRRATGSKIFTSERAGNFRRSRLLFFSGIVPQASAPELAACGSPSLPLPLTHTHTHTHTHTNPPFSAELARFKAGGSNRAPDALVWQGPDDYWTSTSQPLRNERW